MKRLVTLIFMGTTLAFGNTLMQEKSSQLVDKVFGETKVDIHPVSRIFLEDLFYLLATTSTYEQMKACKQASRTLQEQLNRISNSDNGAVVVSDKQAAFTLQVLTIYQTHFERCARLLRQDMPWYQLLLGWIKNNLSRTYCFCASLISINRVTPIKRLTQYLLTYTDLEQAEILTDHQKTLSLLCGHNKYDVPLVVRFWDYPRYRHRLLNAIKELQSGAKPQAADLTDVADAAQTLEELETAAATTAKLDQAVDLVSQEGLENVEGSTAIESFNTQAGEQFEEQLLGETEPEWGDEGYIENEEEELTPEELQNQVKSIQETLSTMISNKVTTVTPKPIATSQEEIADAATMVNNETEAATNTIEDNLDKIQNKTIRKILKTIDPVVNPLKYAMRMLDRQAVTANKALKNMQAFYNKVSAKSPLLQKVSNKLTLKKMPVFDSGKEAALFYLKNPFTALAKGTQWLVVNGLKIALKFTPKNAYRFLIQNSFGKIMLQMIEQTEISMGSQLAISWVNAAQAQEFQALIQQRNSLMTDLNHFFQVLAEQQQATLTRIDAQFTAQSAALTQAFSLQIDSSGNSIVAGLLPSLFVEEKNYLSNSMINTTVKQIFLQSPLQDDQFFTLSPMINSPTPEQPRPATWYNPHREGNWEFCTTDYSQTTNTPVTSFVQYQVEPLLSQAFPQGDPTIAIKNSIFTEYIPPFPCTSTGTQTPYTIQFECTLLSQPQLPFMLGIMFNGARWISGIFDFHHQHRLFCIYALPGQDTYNVGFAETFYMTPQLFDLQQDQLSDNGVPAGMNAIWPAFQILSPSNSILASLGSNTCGITPVPNPLATIAPLEVGVPYLFTIETSANQVQLQIRTKDNVILFPTSKEQSSPNNAQTNSFLISSLNDLIFLYHSIGCMSAGCSAQFIIKQPESLTVSAQPTKGLP